MREALQAIAARTGVRPPELDGPEMPWAAAHVWEWFDDCSRGRSYSMAGPLPLSATEIKHWADMTGTRLEPWEFRALRALDFAWLAATRDDTKKEEPHG